MVLVKDPKSVLDDMRSRVQQQGDVVRKLKADNAPEAVVKSAVEELKARKKLLEAKEIELTPSALPFDRTKLEDLLKQKFFYDQSFAIYGGVQGLYDYGPMGCAMKSNLLSAWRQHFVLEDHLLEVDCSMLTPYSVLQSSGHVDRFTDWMVKDVKTGECFRADHLVKANLENKLNHKKTSEAEKEEIRTILVQLDNMGKDDLDNIIRRFGMKSPNDNALSDAQEFNLMFATTIGPTGHCKGFLRPETAQGIFVNFQRLLQFNQGRIPFGAAQIGTSFRNEISPRSGLIRVREFTMAEIEYFVDPADKRHPKFDQVREVVMNFYSACDQMDGKPARKLTIGEAVDQGMVANQTLGYFMARIHLFLVLIGVDPTRLRFRQHLSNEMAHYACDCWDAECQTSYGWIECVGCADRSCYDLTQHTKATGARLVAEKRLAEPRLVKVHECIPNKEAIGKAFRADAKLIVQRLSQLSLDEKLAVSQQLSSTGRAELKIEGKSYAIEQPMVQIRESETKMHVEEIVPNVIEPSFGIGRILYAVFEHSFRMREGDEQRTYLSLRPILAPYKCSVLPLSTNPELTPFVQQLSKALTRHGVSHRVDESSGSIGRRYARTDQIAIPYGITIDFDTVNISPASATLRERDSMKQIRVPLDELPSLVSDLANGVSTWSEAQAKYPSFEQQETVTQLPIGKETVSEPKPVRNKTAHRKHEKLSGPAAAAHLASHDQRTGSEEPVPGAEEWLSVSEDMDDAVIKKTADQEMECWSSATETAEAGTVVDQAQLVRKLPDPVPEKASSSDKGKTSMKTKTPKLPRSWAECGVAIQRHYQVYRSKPKLDTENSPQPTGSRNWAAEVDEVRSSFSGYEADQEDNVASRSTAAAEQRPPTSHELDTPYQLSPAVHSMDGDKDKQQSSEPSERPYHGLFVGEGWPTEPPASKKQQPVQGKPTKACKSSTERQDTLDVATQSDTTTQSEWPNVLARMTEKSCIPELWQFPSNMDVYNNTLFSEHSMKKIAPIAKDSDHQEVCSSWQRPDKTAPCAKSSSSLKTGDLQNTPQRATDKPLNQPVLVSLADESTVQSRAHQPVCEPTSKDHPFSRQEPLSSTFAADDPWQPWQSASRVRGKTRTTLPDPSSSGGGVRAPASSNHPATAAPREQSLCEQEAHGHVDPLELIVSSQPDSVSPGQKLPDSSRIDPLIDAPTTLDREKVEPVESEAVPAHSPVAEGATVEPKSITLMPTSSANEPLSGAPADEDNPHPSTANISTGHEDDMVSSVKKGKSKRRKPKKKK